MTNPIRPKVFPTESSIQPLPPGLRRFQVLEQTLKRARYENSVRDECLIIARKALEHFLARRDNYASDALAEIGQRLAELEPEEETG